MTVYMTHAESGGTLITAGTNDVRIIGIEILNFSGLRDNGWLYIGTGGTANGTTQSPITAKVGSPASTATAKVAPGDGYSGGSRSVVGGYVTSSSSSTFGSFTWVPLGDLIIPTGATFQVAGGASAEEVWFEELRLSWSY